MKRYQAVPFRLYEGGQGEIIHFAEDTLDLTELTPLHVTVLEAFHTGRTPDEVIQDFSDQSDVLGTIDELIELGLISVQLPQFPIPVVDLRPNIRAFRIVLTEKCNLRCAECFVTKAPDSLRTMDLSVLERTILHTIPYGQTHAVTYHFFGGEPLLRFDSLQRAVAILEEAVARGEIVQPVYRITTNLTILDDKILVFLKAHRFHVGVSIDGPEAVNDVLRTYIDGRGTFQMVAANYQRLREAGIDTHVLITPHPDHLAELPAIFRTVLERFPMETVTVNTPLHYHTVQWTMPGKKYAEVLVQLIRMTKEFGVSIDSAASPPLAALAGNIQRKGPCALTGSDIMASIGPDGSLSYCAQKWHPYLAVPSVEAGSSLRTPIRRATECLSCEARHICGGPCPAYQQIAGGQLDDNKCAFMRALLKEATSNLDLFEAEG
jgi:uncharacterized protein